MAQLVGLFRTPRPCKGIEIMIALLAGLLAFHFEATIDQWYGIEDGPTDCASACSAEGAPHEMTPKSE